MRTDFFTDVSLAISLFKKNGIHISLPIEITNQLSEEFLFDGDDALFKSALKTARVYFEWGCGKSTLWAATHTDSLIYSFDTSSEWVSKVSRQISDMAARAHINFVNVGPLGDWGTPLGYTQRNNFPLYTQHLWTRQSDANVILIDGRFRVCCFLNALKYAKVGALILFDDYVNRPHYHIAEEFLSIRDRCGRQVLFEINKNFKETTLDSLIAQFQNVWD